MGQGLQELQTPPWNLSATRKQTGGGQHLLRPGFESLHLHISGSGTQLSSVHRADKKTEAGSKECENISLQEQAQGGSSCKSSMPRNCTRTKAARPTKPLLEKPNITPLWNFFLLLKKFSCYRIGRGTRITTTLVPPTGGCWADWEHGTDTALH